MHAYAVVDVDASGQRVKLFNPADKPEHTHPNGTGRGSISELKEYVSELDANR